MKMNSCLNARRPYQRRYRIIPVIKIALFFMLAFCVQVHAKSYAQKLTLTVKNAPLADVFEEIRKQSGYLFIYSNKQLEDTKKVSLSVKNAPLEQVLNICFNQQPVTYKLVEKNIVIVPRDVVHATAFQPEQKARELTGTVTDDAGALLQGVSVVLKGASGGTTSDASGKYTITLQNEGVLVFSFTGYVTQEIASANKTLLNVQMITEEKKLEEVVVVGYGSQLKKNISTAISVVSEKDFNKGVTQTAADLLQGKVAGLVITTESGDVTAGQTIRLRGISSLTGSSAPFVVIDGVPGMDLSSVAPQDIESISASFT